MRGDRSEVETGPTVRARVSPAGTSMALAIVASSTPLSVWIGLQAIDRDRVRQFSCLRTPAAGQPRPSATRIPTDTHTAGPADSKCFLGIEPHRRWVEAQRSR